MKENPMEPQLFRKHHSQIFVSKYEVLPVKFKGAVTGPSGYLIDVGDSEIRVTPTENSQSLPLGFGTPIEGSHASHFVAYFANTRISNEAAPAYEDALWLLVDGKVYDLFDPDLHIDVRRRLFSREFRVSAFGQVFHHIRYKYPLFKQLFENAFADPLAQRTDFLEVVMMSCKFYRERRTKALA